MMPPRTDVLIMSGPNQKTLTKGTLQTSTLPESLIVLNVCPTRLTARWISAVYHRSVPLSPRRTIIFTGVSTYVLFMSPSIQKSVRHLHQQNTKFDEEALSHLAKFHNLVSIDFHGLEIMTEEMVAITNARADRLQSLTIANCTVVADELLDAISSCKKLWNADIFKTEVSARAIETKAELKRRNWGALQ